MAKDIIKSLDNKEDFLLDKSLKISNWTSTVNEYKYLIKDFEDRMNNFPDRELFISKELGRIIDSTATFEDNYNEPYNKGVEFFERGLDHPLDFIEIEISEDTKFKNHEINSSPVVDYLLQMSKGYAHAKFYYYVRDKYINKEKKTDETMPEFEYNSEAQKIAWLYKLDVLSTILEKCKNGDGSYNWNRSAKVINSFTGINIDTIRKSLMAIYNPGTDNDKNNPLNNPENLLFISEMASKFKLSKDE